jgi:hypothetical protein
VSGQKGVTNLLQKECTAFLFRGINIMNGNFMLKNGTIYSDFYFYLTSCNNQFYSCRYQCISAKSLISAAPSSSIRTLEPNLLPFKIKPSSFLY